MAVESIAIAPRQFRKLTLPVVGLRISKPWLGYANALFLELGALHFEFYPLRRLGTGRKLKTKSLKGQAGVMIDSDWRVEKQGRFAFGRDSKDGAIRRGIRMLRGSRVRGVHLQACGPELFLELEGGVHIHSFSTHSEPCWAVFLGDPLLFPRDPRWLEYDHSLVVTFDEETGRLEKKINYGPKPD
jgi:hypothetical protein